MNQFWQRFVYFFTKIIDIDIDYIVFISKLISQTLSRICSRETIISLFLTSTEVFNSLAVKTIETLHSTVLAHWIDY
jgi:hypothetical protein